MWRVGWLCGAPQMPATRTRLGPIIKKAPKQNLGVALEPCLELLPSSKLHTRVLIGPRAENGIIEARSAGASVVG